MFKLTNRIKEIRKRQGLTLKGVGDLVGAAPIQIKRLEDGDRRITVEWLERLAPALKCSPIDLIAYPNDLFEDEAGEIYSRLSEEKKLIATQVLKGLLAEQKTQKS